MKDTYYNLLFKYEVYVLLLYGCVLFFSPFLTLYIFFFLFPFFLKHQLFC